MTGTPADQAHRDATGDPRPRVLLIGTSNAVYADGYAGVLARCDAFRSFDNRSVGLASSALFCLQRPTIDFSRYDLCILDFCCNDASLMTAGQTSEDLVRAQMEEAIATVAAAGCLPVLLIYPIVPAMPDGGAVRRIYRTLAEAHRLPFLDVYALFEGLGVQPFVPARVFTDTMHLRLDVARAIGRQLAAALAQGWPFARTAGEDHAVEGHAHRLVGAWDFALRAGDTVVRRQTRLARATCADLPASRRSLSVRPDEAVVATAANFGFSNGLLTIEGRSQATLRVSTEHFRADGTRLLLGVWPVCPPVDAKDGSITLDVRPDALTGTLCGHGPLAEGPPVVSLVGLVLRRPARLCIRTVLPRAIDLGATLHPGVAEALVAIHDDVILSAVVDALYRGLLARPADATGLADNVDRLRVGGLAKGLAEACDILVRSPEFCTRYGMRETPAAR